MIAAALALLVIVTLMVLLVLQRTIRLEPRTTRAPILWLDDAVWRSLADDRLVRRPLVSEPQIVFADDTDRKRAPHWRAGELALALPQPRVLYLRELARVRGQPSIRQPVWPICCGQLAALTYTQGRGIQLADLEAAAGPLDLAYLEEEIRGWGYSQGFAERGWGDILASMRKGEHQGKGINIFHCRCCGALYVASCAPS